MDTDQRVVTVRFVFNSAVRFVFNSGVWGSSRESGASRRRRGKEKVEEER